MNFVDKLLKAARANKSLLCIGLDPDPQLMPAGVGIVEFNRAIVDATSDLVCAYKPNLAFYETLGAEGFDVLKDTIACVPESIPTIGDAKRGDIGNTAKMYAKSLFEMFGFDAATVNPLMGFDSLEPFIEYRDRGVLVLCRTSNPGSADLQDQLLSSGPMYELIAELARQWNKYGNIGLVMGATYPEEISRVRAICPDMPLLIPGVGAQSGDLVSAVRYGVDAKGQKAIISSSRQVIYASKGKDFAEAAREAALKLRDEINRYLEDV